MANSSIIFTLKNNIVNALCDDPIIDSVIDSSKYHGKQLKGTHIFDYNKLPETIADTKTFIVVMGDSKIRETNRTYMDLTLSLFIYSHDGHMDLPQDFLSNGEVFNRNDYLAYLIDKKFNGSHKYGGFETLKLIENNEFSAAQDFYGRRLFFKTADVNESLCERW